VRKARFAALVQDYRDRLGQVYDQKTMPPEDMRVAKAQIIAELRHAYADLKTSWGGYAGYDYWFAGPLNNAQLASVNLYHRWLPAFRALLIQEDNDLPRFYAQVRQLADMPRKEREAALEALMPAPALAVR
jgi:predicted aminopeptidase